MNTGCIKCFSCQYLGTMANYVIWLTNVDFQNHNFLRRKGKLIHNFLSSMRDKL